MIVPAVFLAVTLVGALFTLNAYRPLVRWGPLSIVSFFAGWLTSELPIHHLMWQVIATAVFVGLGALRAWPGWVAMGITLVSWFGLVRLVTVANRARDLVEEALTAALGADYRERILPALATTTDPRLSRSRLALPFRTRHPHVVRTRNVQYAPWGRRGRLDVYRHRDLPTGAPVLLQVHGGGWVIGNKEQQGIPLMTHLASLGWVCVAINYRLSPRATFPEHVEDVKRAIAWIREHVHDHGGDPDFVAITGGSAGGHLAALAALTPDDPEYQPGFEDRDTTVQAAVPFYGVYDFANRDGAGRTDMRRFLERMVMKKKLSDDPDAFDRASPVARVNADAPPFFVIHGRNDTLVPIGEARRFVERLRGVSRRQVAYVELPGAQHAFEVFASVRTAHVVRAVERFLAVVYSDWSRARDTDAARAAGD